MPRAQDVCLVTGAAGFIGSHLCERLLAEGCAVLGLDCFTDTYDRRQKEANLRVARQHPAFRLVEVDLCTAELAPLLAEVAYVFHLAAEPGVRASWGGSFARYVERNVLATQRLLEAARGRSLRRFVLASSSSVYGNTSDLPMRESSSPRPVSPYGVTKLAAELLGRAYHATFGLPVVSLRFFTVYGPRQRPDMAFHRFIRAALAGAPIPLYGNGTQTRDVTYVGDVVEASLLAARHGQPGAVYNVGGGSRVALTQVVALLEELLARPVAVERWPAQPGDVAHTEADCSAARAIGFQPRVGLRAGLAAELRWFQEEAVC